MRLRPECLMFSPSISFTQSRLEEVNRIWSFCFAEYFGVLCIISSLFLIVHVLVFAVMHFTFYDSMIPLSKATNNKDEYWPSQDMLYFYKRQYSVVFNWTENVCVSRHTSILIWLKGDSTQISLSNWRQKAQINEITEIQSINRSNWNDFRFKSTAAREKKVTNVLRDEIRYK